MIQTVQLNLDLVVPTMDAADNCLTLLTDRLRQRKGIVQAHVVQDDGAPQLCLHFDPNRISLGQVERLAHDTGTAIGDRYRHEELRFSGLDAADSADTLTQELMRLPGMLHANVNYAAGFIFVAYDTTMLQRSVIEQTVRWMGARLTVGATTVQDSSVTTRDAEDAEHAGTGEGHDAHTGHDHGSAPAFLPNWMQDRWTLILVGLAGLFLMIGWAGEMFFGLPASVALIFFILAYIAGGYDIATHAIPGLLRGKFDTDVLMLAAAAGAAILGAWTEGAFLLFLFSLGHTGEHYALDRARNAVNALGELMPQTARVRRGDQITEVNVADLRINDVVVVRPGDRVPVDGTVANGRSTIDQSPITGESVPVEKSPGDEVFAGTINHDAALDVNVTRLTKDSTLSRVMQMVAEAQSQQSPTQQFTQRFTRWFVPTVLVVVALVIVVPPLVGWLPLTQSFYRACCCWSPRHPARSRSAHRQRCWLASRRRRATAY